MRTTLLFLGLTCQVALAQPALVFMQEREGSKQVMTCHLDGSGLKRLTEGPEWHLYPDVSPDGQTVVWSQGPDEQNLGIVVKSHGRERWLVPPRGRNLQARLARSASLVAFSGPLGPGGAARIGLVDPAEGRAAAGNGRRVAGAGADVEPNGAPAGERPGGGAAAGAGGGRRAAAAGADNGPSGAPAGERPGAAAAGERSGRAAHGVCGAAGTAQTTAQSVRVLPSDHEAYFPAPSADGRFLVYQGNSGGDKAIYRRQLPDGVPVRLVSGMSPSLSFDDQEVAYTSQVDGNWDVYVYNLQTGLNRRVTTSPARELAPAFLPDGSLVYCSDASGRFQLSGAASVTDPGSLYAPRSTGDLNLGQGLKTPIPGKPRSSFGAARREGEVFLVGGHQGHEHSYPPESFVDRLDRYDAGVWEVKSPRPVAAHGFAVVADGNFLYAFGGFAFSAEHKPGWKSLDRIDRYDVTTDRWEEVGRLPRPRSSNVAVRKGDLVYLLGGWDSTPRQAGDKAGRFHAEIDVFDLKSGKCSTLAARLPNPLRRAFSGCLVGQRILLAGGIGEGGQHFALLDNVTSFDPGSGRFEDLPPLPFPTFAPALGALGDRLFVLGGMFRVSSEDYRYVPHIFRLGERGWAHTGRYLSESKGFAQVVSLADGSLGILGGHTYRPDGTDSPVATFETLSLLGGLKKLSVEP